jgi:CheY-like chemotaxis protein
MALALERSGYNVRIAGSFEQAISEVERNGFDLLVSDLGLPDRSGLDLMKAIRASDRALKGVALSGFGREEDVQASREAGFSAHLTKPVDLNTLMETIIKTGK